MDEPQGQPPESEPRPPQYSSGYPPPPPAIPQPLRRSGLSPVTMILMASCGLAMLAVAAAVGIGMLVARNSFFSDLTGGRPTGGRGGGLSPGVQLGQLTWRPLRTARNGQQYSAHMYQAAITGDVDGDGDDEILALDMLGGPELLEVDGTHVANLAQGDTPLAIWDTTGDGKGEIIVSGPQQQIEAKDLKGHVVKTMPFSPVMMVQMNPMGGDYKLRGDADGDGQDELWLSPKGSYSDISAVNGSGQAVVKWSGSMSGDKFLVCDYDGNGKSGCAYTDYSGKLYLIGIGGTKQFGELRGKPLTGCMDVNADGQPDILCGEDGYFDHATAAYTPYPQPGGFAPPYDFAGTYVQFDFDGDGKLEMVYAGPDADQGKGGHYNGRIRIFDPRAQTVLYDEVVDSGGMLSIAVAQAGGKDYLVLPNQGDLLIYP
jgi:hypothetical protein